MLTTKDISEIKEKGATVDQIKAQIERLKNGMTYSNLDSAAIIGNGIEKYSKDEVQKMIKEYEAESKKMSILKFVPASGAASRMFKFLFQFLNDFDPVKESLSKYLSRKDEDLLNTFFGNLVKFPFYNEVVSKMRSEIKNYEAISTDEKNFLFARFMLGQDHLNYSFFPKGLLPFHKYTGAITAFHEHLFESTLYASSNGNSNLHFTVSPKHQNYFTKELDKIKSKLELENETVFNISFSYQKEATETVALTNEGELYRHSDGSILFRPAGHGALIENLNTLDNDIIFIKNIDNIVVQDKNLEISEYKKLLAGVLIEAQKTIFNYMHKLDGNQLSDQGFDEVCTFLKNKLNIHIKDEVKDYSKADKIAFLKEKLNRPIRVCGMVKNEGEPGGGPFWVKDADGNLSLQIVEFAQIDFDKEDQQSIVEKATHFNPTDLVCGVKNYRGEKFNLLDYVDPDAAFITMKTQDGVDIKALELPGLWNGSMAFWNSIFVEVPLETFNPVKTVNDLLKPAHQA